MLTMEDVEAIVVLVRYAVYENRISRQEFQKLLDIRSFVERRAGRPDKAWRSYVYDRMAEVSHSRRVNMARIYMTPAIFTLVKGMYRR